MLIYLIIALSLAVVATLLLGPSIATPEIIWKLRLPRALAGLLVGAALATAGTLFQGILRNPLADPYILGTSSGASLGVLLAGLCHFQSPIILYTLALVFSMGSVLAVYRIARVHGKAPVQTLILSGVVISTFLNALVFIGFTLFFKGSFSTLFFLLGTLAEYDPTLLKISGVLIAVGVAAACAYAGELNILSQGEETARHLGIDPENAKRRLFFIASVLVSAAVALSGMIGFVGLIVPHCLRLLVGPDHRSLIPSSALGGAVLLVVLDTVARTAAAPREIPVGTLAALCGTPFFLYLLRKKKGELY